MSRLGPRWRKSSGSGSGECVEVRTGEGSVEVRDTKNRNALTLRVPLITWGSFIDGAKAGEFDRSA